MNRSTTAFLFALLLFPLLATNKSHAQARKRTPIQVSCACVDAGGKAYLHALRERLAASLRFREARSDEPADDSVIRVEIVSHALPPKSRGDFNRTAIDIICLHDGETMRQSVETCNRLPIDFCVDSMLSELGTM